MRLKGKLINWDSDKAFGFIAPNGGGEHIFIHKTALSNRNRVPQINDVITFAKVKNKDGRYCASDATFTGEKLKKKAAKKASKFSIYLSVLFLAMITTAYFFGHLHQALLFGYLAISAGAFLAYASDKSKAQRRVSRIPENTLHLFSLIGGWPGAAIAQQLLRHKTQKREFRIVFWFTVIANTAGLLWLLSPQGQHVMAIFQ